MKVSTQYPQGDWREYVILRMTPDEAVELAAVLRPHTVAPVLPLLRVAEEVRRNNVEHETCCKPHYPEGG